MRGDELYGGLARERRSVTYPIEPRSTGDEWGEPLSTWGANKLTLNVGANSLQVQLSRDEPPSPPTWDQPITLPPGPWSHTGPFGWVRFRNANRGVIATVFGTAYAE